MKLKELGLPEGHPEKEGVTVSLENLAEEIKQRIGHQAVGDLLAATDALVLDS